MTRKIFRYLGLALVFLYFFGGGVAHFVATDMFVKIVPPYIPFPLSAVYVSGVFEVLGAIGIWLPRWREWAGNGLLLLTVCVTPANVYMWMNPQLFPEMSQAALFWRLPLQVLLLALIWWSTRPVTQTSP
ncbi:MAG: DoxX family protein [Gammaproteobacteria bacterium]